MTTARHVYPPGVVGGIPLIAANVVITEGILGRLVKSGVRTIFIEDEFSAGIENLPPLTDDTRQQAVTVIKDTFGSMGREGGSLTQAQMQDIESMISRILVEVSGRRSLLVCLSDLNLFGGERMQRALDVCVLGMAIARQFFRTHGWRDFRGQRREDGIDDRLVKLGMGLLLQDVGMLAVPESIREKRGILTAEERAIVQQHPLLGLELLDGSELSPLTKVTIAQHHERFDGSGYPKALSGDDVHDHGQIAAIADAYVSLCEEQADGQQAFLPHEAYKLILQASGRLFRPEVVDAFSAAVAPYGPGTSVQLSDGRFALVVGNHPNAPLDPVVRVTHDEFGMLFDPPIEVDLAKSRGAITIAGPTEGLPGDRGIATALG